MSSHDDVEEDAMTAARTDETNLAVVGSPWHGRRRRRLAGVLLAAGACLVSFPVATLAASSSSAAAYCSHLPAAKVTSILGSKVSFKAAVLVKTTLECEYAGAAFVTLLKEPGIPAANLATLSKAEATALSGFPKGTKVNFAALPALGKTSFSWTATIEGLQFSGVGENKGTTGYGAEMSGKPDIPKLKRLIALAITD
jgi:hypothetical protein